jgi:hypothetical protein
LQQAFIWGCLAIMEGSMARLHGVEEVIDYSNTVLGYRPMMGKRNSTQILIREIATLSFAWLN